jgi:hypothetical protein
MAFVQLSRLLSIKMYPLMGGSRRSISFSAQAYYEAGKIPSEFFLFIQTQTRTLDHNGWFKTTSVRVRSR